MSSVIERTLKGGAGFFMANVIKRGLGFLFVVVASRILGPAEFGLLALGLSVVGVARKFAAFGLPNTIQRFLSGEGEERGARLYGVILIIGGMGGLSVSVGLYTAASRTASFFGDPALTGPLQVLAFSVALGVGFSLFRSILQAQEQVGSIVVVDTVRSAAKLGLLFPLFLWMQSAVSAAWAVVGAFGLALIITNIYAQKLDIDPVFSAEWTEVRTILGYSAPLVVVGFGYFLAQQADRLMLGWLASSSDVGIYTVAAKLSMIMGLVQGALGSIFKPIVSEAYRNHATEQMRKSYLFISKWAGTAAGIVLLTYAGTGSIVLKVFGADFFSIESYYVLVILSSFHFFGALLGPTGALLQVTDGHRIEMVNTIIFGMSNITLNYMLIQSYGVMGAAIATMLSGVIWNFIQIGEIYYLHDLHPFNMNTIVMFLWIFSGTVTLIGIPRGTGKFIGTLGSILGLFTYVIWTANREEERALRRLTGVDFSSPKP